MGIYTKEKIVEFFNSMGNSTLKEFESILQKDGWDTDFQPASENILTATVSGSKGHKGMKFGYGIKKDETEITPNSYFLNFEVTRDRAGYGETVPDNDIPDINTLTKDELLKHIKDLYDKYMEGR